MPLFTQYFNQDVNQAYQALKFRADLIKRQVGLSRPVFLSRQISKHRHDIVEIANEVVNTFSVIITNALLKAEISKKKAAFLRQALRDATLSIEVDPEITLKVKVVTALILSEAHYNKCNPEEAIPQRKLVLF